VQRIKHPFVVAAWGIDRRQYYAYKHFYAQLLYHCSWLASCGDQPILTLLLKVVPPSRMPLSGSGTWSLFAPSRRTCESRFSKKFFSKKNFSVGEGVVMSGFAMKTAGVFVPLLKPSRYAWRQTEWQLPARRQDKWNDRGLEAHQIAAVTSA
jgi:hypothetical protein